MSSLCEWLKQEKRVDSFTKNYYYDIDFANLSFSFLVSLNIFQFFYQICNTLAIDKDLHYLISNILAPLPGTTEQSESGGGGLKLSGLRENGGLRACPRIIFKP